MDFIHGVGFACRGDLHVAVVLRNCLQWSRRTPVDTACYRKRSVEASCQTTHANNRYYRLAGFCSDIFCVRSRCGGDVAVIRRYGRQRRNTRVDAPKAQVT